MSVNICRKTVDNPSLAVYFDTVLSLLLESKIKEYSFDVVALRVVIGSYWLRRLFDLSEKKGWILSLPSEVFKYLTFCYTPAAPKDELVLVEFATPEKPPVTCYLRIPVIDNGLTAPLGSLK